MLTGAFHLDKHVKCAGFVTDYQKKVKYNKLFQALAYKYVF